MIDLDILKSHGVSSEALKTIFDGKMREDLSDPQRKWLDRARSRIQRGIDENLTSYQVYHALDVAWDTPFRQMSSTLLSTLHGKDPTDETVLNMIKEFGLTSLVQTRDIEDPKTGKKSKVIDAPMFFSVTVPLVRAYTTIRWAKIVNDRRLTPHFKYEPIKDTPKNRLRAETITDRVQTISTQFGYFEILKQCVFHMLHYSFARQFPVEAWHTEEQILKDDDGKPKKKVVKEGIRYHLPHPSRTGWDKAHRLSTINTDTGVEFLFYWRVFRFGDIAENKGFWNRDKVSIGAHDWRTQHSGYWLTAGSACTMSFPQSFVTSNDGMALDRERIMADGFYTSDLNDSAVTLTEYFEKIVPKDCGFGNYEHPVWFRFVIASDDTVVYAAPLPYSPCVYYGYDAHEGRVQNASLSLEVQPYQDQVSNLLSQLLLSSKQNLANITWVDTDQVDEKTIQKLLNWGERLWRSFNVERFSSRKWRSGQMNVSDAVRTTRFPQLDTASIINAIKVVMDVAERTLAMSSQEVAQAATHEQTREEVRQISATTTSRLTFTATPVDLAINAWKRQVYQGLMAYGEEESYVQVDGDTLGQITEDDLKTLGFTVEEKATAVGRKALVKAAKKTAIALEDFSSTRDGEDRSDNVAAATAMSNFLLGLLGNPVIAPNIGGEQAIKMANLIARMAGFPRDFKLQVTDDPAMREQQAEEARGELAKVATQISQKYAQEAAMQVQVGIMQQIMPKLQEIENAFKPITTALKQEMDVNKQQDQAVATILKTLENVEKAITALAGPALPPPMDPALQPPMLPPPNAIIPPPPPIPAEQTAVAGTPPPFGLV